MRVGLLVVCLGIAIPSWTHVAAAEPASDDRIERAWKATLDPTYQPTLPRYESEAGSGSADTTESRMRRRRSGDTRRLLDTREQREQQREQGSVLMTFVMWGLLLVMAVLGAVWVVSELRGDGSDPHAPDEALLRTQAEVDAIIERPLGDADELARHGNYVEAIHTLLLRTLQELVRSAAVRVAPAMTSREILARVPLLADARVALSNLITAVEISHFGDEPATAADYERCRQQFHVFASAFRAAPRTATDKAAA